MLEMVNGVVRLSPGLGFFSRGLSICKLGFNAAKKDGTPFFFLETILE